MSKPAILLFALFVSFCSFSNYLFSQEEASAAEQSAEEWKAIFSVDGRSVSVKDWRSRNLWMRQAAATSMKSSDTWRYFMHGFRDHQAIPIAWQQLFNNNNGADKWIDSEQSLRNEMKQSDFPVLLLEGEKILLFPKPIFDIHTLAGLKGRKLRFYVWIKAEDCGGNRGLWDASPTLTLSLKDSLNNLISTESSLFKTRGTFPWFCYHMEISIPALLNTDLLDKKILDDIDGFEDLDFDLSEFFEAFESLIPELPDGGGLYLTISNLGGGKVWFSTLSWELVENKNTPPISDWADPVSGSRAPNAFFDELPMHLFFGLDAKKNWSFLSGNQNSPNITTVEGLGSYIDSVNSDWFHMQYGVALLAYLQQTGTILQQCDSFDSNWLDKLNESLLALQNSETGLWQANKHDNLLVTHAIAKHSFNPKTLQRSDKEQEETPWLSINNAGIPNSSILLNSLLQSRLRNTRTGRLEGWSRYVFQAEEFSTSSKSQFNDLATSSAAVQLLAMIASQTNNEAERMAAQTAIKEVWSFAVNNLLTADYLWRQNDLSASVSSSAFFFPLLEASQWLEKKINPNLKVPELESRRISAEQLHLHWLDKNPQFASIRLYAAKAELEVDKINEKHLVMIINRDENHFHGCDPLYNLRKLAVAAARRWGISLEKEGASYLAEKLAMLSEKLIFADSGRELIYSAQATSSENEDEELQYYFSAVTSYGEMTELQKITELE